MFSYLERKVNVMKVLRGAHRALKGDGAIFARAFSFGALKQHVISTKWRAFRESYHLNGFTLPTLRAVAVRSNTSEAVLSKIIDEPRVGTTCSMFVVRTQSNLQARAVGPFANGPTGPQTRCNGALVLQGRTLRFGDNNFFNLRMLSAR